MTREGVADRLKILIADEDPDFTQVLTDLCRSVSGLQPVGTARSQEMLLARVNHFRPDLVFLDMSPELGGIEIVRTLKNNDPGLHLIVLYPPDRHDADILVEALEAGVCECMAKPRRDDPRALNEFRLTLMTVTGLLLTRKRFYGRPSAPEFSKRSVITGRTGEAHESRGIKRMEKAEVVVMASSTGGPEILNRIFSLLPGTLQTPILLVQHIPADMTRFFAESLNRKSELTVLEAVQGDTILPARVYIAPGGRHMTVSMPDPRGRRTIILDDRPGESAHRPSADVLFESAARSYDGTILAVILTGMGEDGRKGVARMKTGRCVCVSQAAETCVVYGMPRAVDEAGLSDERLDPLAITRKIVAMAQKNRRHP